MSTLDTNRAKYYHTVAASARQAELDKIQPKDVMDLICEMARIIDEYADALTPNGAKA